MPHDATSPTKRATQTGTAVFGAGFQPSEFATAPGRLELLGNHVDYNGGLVLAGAIEQSVVVAISPTGQPGQIDVVARDVSDDVVSLRIADLVNWQKTDGETGPADFARGVIASLLGRQLAVRDSLQVVISGDVPLGFGMSSSAALCVALVLAFSEAELSPTERVVIAQEGEHRTGSPCGAMDQSASVAGGVILFDGRDTSFSAMTPDLGDLAFVVADSGITHALGTSSYPVRVQESRQALAALNGLGAHLLPSLGELTPEQWNGLREAFLDAQGPVLTRRVDHVVTEIERVRDGVAAVEASDWARFGALMSASGASSNDAYEISHPVVEELVALLRSQPGVLGARMMGGGEGGPALALVERYAVNDLRTTLEADYFRRHPSHLNGERLQVAAFGPGARLLPTKQ